MHAVVVDDEEIIRLVAVEALEQAGIPAIAYESADRALAEWPASGRVGLVLTDVRMPGRADGLGLATRLAETRPDLPVIVMSGSEGELRKARLLPGVFGVLAKPFDPAELAAMARRATPDATWDGQE